MPPQASARPEPSRARPGFPVPVPAQPQRRALYKLRRFLVRMGPAYLLILPAVIAMLFVHYIPMAGGLLVSFRDINLFAVNRWYEAPWVGLDNFVAGLDPSGFLGARFWRSLWNVTYFGAVTIFAGYVIGMGVAILLNRPFPLRSLVRGLILLP